ncbi:MAG TPA: peptidoglycan DD-metalloendopeptidase family protein [candidate division Zixibacteria bacterium]|nr:peptidoglycan DD-metalloendopeptidase family protein [candidate division Zixibacteria bacterium]
MRRVAAIAVGFAVAAAAASLHAAGADRDLDKIRKKIEAEKRGLSRVQKQEGSVLQALGEIQSALQKRNAEVRRASARLEELAAGLRAKQAEGERLRASLERQRALLAKRAAALYRWQRSGSPLVILNGAASLAVVQRRKHYLQAALAFDQELINDLKQGAARQEQVTRELAQKQQEIEEQHRALAAAREELAQEAEKKKRLLASLRREKETRQRALKELEQAALRLQKMMEEFARRSAARPREGPAGTGLERLRGRLDWPVKGQLVGGFGRTRHKEFGEEIFRKGIDIEAPVGEGIKAVEQGRVVFADRFSGYGNMLIVDHGERYYSIYAHLSEFLKKTGDLVKRGEVIGRVGDSDSLSGARLYFELRKDGKPVDPLAYLKGQ